MLTPNFEYDGSSMIGWTSPSAGSYNFTTIPGGAALAGSYTANATTTTWAPLLDLDGSTIGLVSSANVDAGPVTTYIYDPSGTPTATGTANDWPFQFKGMEKEFTDPGSYYYTGDGRFYSPQFVRSLSEAGQTSASGPGGGSSGHGGGGGGGGNGGSNPFLPSFSFPTSGSQVAGDLQNGAEAAGASLAAGAAYAAGAYIFSALTVGFAEASIAFPPLAILAGGFGLFELFDQLFGGGSDSPPTPRQLLNGRHPLYWKILGVPVYLIVDETSAGTPEFRRSPSGEEYSRCPPSVSFPACVGTFLAFSAPTAVGCGVFLLGCNPANLPSCGLMVGTCGAEIGGIVGCYSQAHCGEFGNPGEELPPGDFAPSPPLVKPGTEGAVP